MLHLVRYAFAVSAISTLEIIILNEISCLSMKYVYCSHPLFSITEQQLTSFIVSAMMALLGSASPARLASDTASPNGLKQGSGVYSMTW